jgi:hypothetical protein
MYLTINDYVICSDVKSKFYRAMTFDKIVNENLPMRFGVKNNDQLKSWNTVPMDENTFCLSSCDENGNVFYVSKNDDTFHSCREMDNAVQFTNMHGRFVFDDGELDEDGNEIKYCLAVGEYRRNLNWTYFDLDELENTADCCVSLKHNMDNNDNNLGDYVLK